MSSLAISHRKSKKKKLEGRRKKPTTKNEYTLVIIHTHNTRIYNHVCCYSTNRVRRRPQGHQGPSTSRRIESPRGRFRHIDFAHRLFFLFFKERWSSMMHRRVVSFFFFERDVRRAVRSSGCDDGTKERGALRNDAKVSSRGFPCGRSSERCGVAV